LQVQKLIIKGLPSTCSRHEDYVDQVGDVLAQLLTIRDSQELLLVRKSLNSILEKYPKASILAMHKAVTKAESIEEKVVMLQFMDEKVIRINGELTPFMRRQITEIYCRMLVSSTPDEIEIVLRFIGKSRQITEQEKQVAFKAALTCLVDEGVKQDQKNNIEECSEFSRLISNLVKIVLVLRRNDEEWNVDFLEIELVSVVVYNILQRNPFIAQELSTISDIWKPRAQSVLSAHNGLSAVDFWY
ncbi:hypothetical protein TELCIR_16466, partial [Teladorsagia circumcincta]